MRSLVLALVLLGGCGSGSEPATNSETATSSISLVVTPNNAELTPGATVKLEAFILRGDGREPTTQAEFVSNNEAIARVELHTGVVTGVAPGRAMITARYGPGSAMSAITVR